MNIVRQCTRAGATALVMVAAMLQPLPAQQGDVPPDDSGRVPAGTRFTVRLEAAIDAAESRVGDSFSARVTSPSGAGSRSGRVPVGAIVTGTIAGVKRILRR